MTHYKFPHTILWALLIALSTTVATHAHGTLMYPASRSWTCWMEDPQTPDSAACQEAVRVSGAQPIVDWYEVNQADPGDTHQAVKDGELCNASKANYAGINLARDDWPKTYLIPDENDQISMLYNATAPHRTAYWRFYITKDGWDPLEPLKWGDLEDEPFCEVGHVPEVGPVGDQRYTLDCPAPTDKEGEHIIYLVWQRADSTEAFYSCSDVVIMDVTPTPTPVLTGPCASPNYSDVVEYRTGDSALFNGQAWEAKWWTKGAEPGSNDAWQLAEENCTGGGTPVTSTPTPIQPTHTPTIETSTETPIPPTPIPTESGALPLNVGHSAGSNTSPNSVIVLFAVTVSLGLIGTVKMISGREQ